MFFELVSVYNINDLHIVRDDAICKIKWILDDQNKIIYMQAKRDQTQPNLCRAISVPWTPFKEIIHVVRTLIFLTPYI